MRQERHQGDLCTQRQVQTKWTHQDILQKTKKKTQNNVLKCPFPGSAPPEGRKGIKMAMTSVVWDCCALPSRTPEAKDFPLKWVCRKKNKQKNTHLSVLRKSPWSTAASGGCPCPSRRPWAPWASKTWHGGGEREWPMGGEGREAEWGAGAGGGMFMHAGANTGRPPTLPTLTTLHLLCW